MVQFGNVDFGPGGKPIKRDGQGILQKDGTFKAIYYFDKEFANYFNGNKPEEKPNILPGEIPNDGDWRYPQNPEGNNENKPPLRLPGSEDGEAELPKGVLPEGNKGTPITDGKNIVLPEDNFENNDNPLKIPSPPNRGTDEVQPGPHFVLPNVIGEIKQPDGNDKGLIKGVLPEEGDKKPVNGETNTPKNDKPKAENEPHIDTSKYGNLTQEEMNKLIDKAKKEVGDGIAKAFKEARDAKTPTQDTRASNGLNLADANKIYHHMVSKYGTLSKDTMSPEDWALLQMANVVFSEIGTKANNDGTLPKNYDGWDTSKADELLGEK